MSDKAATATAMDLEIANVLGTLHVAPEVVDALFDSQMGFDVSGTRRRKPKRKRNSTVPVQFTNERPEHAKYVAARCVLRLPEVMAPNELNVPLCNDQDWLRVQLLAEITVAYAKSNLVPNKAALSHTNTMEALMRSKFWSVRDPMWRDIVDCAICYFNVVSLPRDHVMLDKYVEIALKQWRKLVESHGRAQVQHEMDRMLWSV